MNIIKFAIVAALALLALDLVSNAFSQSMDPLRYKPDISEDQVIVCVKDISDSEYRGQVYCGYYQADNDHPRTIQNIQEDLFKNPFNETFEMGLID